MATERYVSLGLSDNPFPRIPTVDPGSRDARMNGSIYDEEIVTSQIAALRQRLERRENMVYAQNTRFVVGVGKSALIAREWRRLQETLPETTVFVRCGRGTQASTVGGACSAIVDSLVRNGALWKAFCGGLLRYVREASRPVLERGIVDNLIARHPIPPPALSARELMVWDVRPTVDSIASWLEAAAPRVRPDVARGFLDCMFTKPGKFTEVYAKEAKRQEVTSFITIVELLNIGGVGYLYVFLDQFEELFHGRGKKELHDLASSMRQILEASSGMATFVVTLHPSAHQSLASMDGQTLTTIAPLDDRHVVDLPNISPAQAVHLAQTYLAPFRLAEIEPVTRSAPFEDSCIESISGNRDGNIREVLQILHYSVEAAVEHGAEWISEEFLQQHHREITGRVSEQDLELR